MSNKEETKEKTPVIKPLLSKVVHKKNSVFKLLLLSSFLGFSFFTLAFPLLAATGIGMKIGEDLFKELPAELTVLPPSQQSVILASDGSTVAKFYAQNRIVVPISKMSKHIQDVIVALEDKRFYEHKGIDLRGMARALLGNMFSDSLQGASTLTQQYVKNALLDTAIQKNDEKAAKKAIEPTIYRKIREAKYAMALERKLKKSQILQGYLNIASFGAKVYGVEAASQYYFGHSAESLTLDESVLLAGITQSPFKYDPVINPKNAKNRQKVVANVLLTQGKITKQDYDRIVNTPIEQLLNVHHNQQGCATAGNAAYFCSYVVHEIEKIESLGKTPEERRQLLLRGGLTIKTTLDPKKQEAAFKAATEYVPVNDRSNVKISVTSVEPGTGKVLAMAQNTNWGSPSEEDRTATQVSFASDKDHGGGYGKQTGSTFKIFTLAQWFKAGNSAYERLGGRYSYSANEWNIPCAPGNAVNYKFSDAMGTRNGPTTVMEGTRKSLNSVYMAMAQRLNMCEITGLAGKMGMTSGDGKPLKTIPSAILGSNEVPPLQVTNAFASFGARGKYCKPKVLLEIVKQDGQKFDLNESECEQVIDENTIDKANLVLNKTWQGYSAPLSGRQAAAKTGTTDNNTNLWFVGYTPNLATGVWVGHSEGNVPLRNINIAGRHHGIIWGENLGTVWSRYMNNAMADMPVVGFRGADLGNGEEDDANSSSQESDNDHDFSHLPPPPPGYEWVYEE